MVYLASTSPGYLRSSYLEATQYGESIELVDATTTLRLSVCERRGESTK